MQAFIDLIRRFRADERGAFAIMFGLMAVVLIAMGGAVVDFVSLEQTRTRAQVALDAAALALQHKIFEEPVNAEQIRLDALALVEERIASDRVEVSLDAPRISVEDGSLLLVAHIDMPTIFVSLVGVQHMGAALFSEATRKMLDLEVVMVLDNSGSMQGTRMTNLKVAAKCATNIIFYGEEAVDANCNPATNAATLANVKMGIVPFTMMVNIGTQFENETWLDWAGQSAISQLNFDDNDNDGDIFNGPVNRRTLFSQTGTKWRGCVEARLAPYDTNDVAPTTPETKFIPMFAPDTINGDYNNYLDDLKGTCRVNTCSVIDTQTSTTKNGKTTWGTAVRTYNLTIGTIINTPSTSCLPPNPLLITAAKEVTNGSTRTTTTVYSALSARERQERLCKYDGQTATDTSTKGPNAYCPSVSILPLTETVKDVQSRITAMTADGGTNIQQGAVWGMHALTPGEPMTEGLSPDDTAVSKVMIVMTDGFNEPDYQSYSSTQNGTAIYQAWGFRKDARLGAYNAFNSKADMTVAIDAKTVATCQSAKEQGRIKVYTIGLNPPSQATKDMLTACSSGDGYYFFPKDPSELKDTFIKIAGQLSQLRLAQ